MWRSSRHPSFRGPKYTVQIPSRFPRGGSYDDIATLFNCARKYVATRKGADRTWKDSVELRDGAKDVAKLKQEDGPALVTQGSTELVHSLLAAGLRPFTFPVLLGKGKRLFADNSEPRAFKLTQSAVSPNEPHPRDVRAQWRPS